MRFSYDHITIAQTTWRDYQERERQYTERRAQERATYEAQQAASWHDRMLTEYPIPDEFRDAAETRFNVHGVGFVLSNDVQISIVKNKPGHLAYTAYVEHPSNRERQSFSDDDFEPLLYLALGCAVAIDVRPHDDFDALDEPTPDPQPPTPESSPDMRIEAALTAIRCELERAQHKHKPLNSLHETYAVILEEMEEFWDAVKATATSTAMSEHIREELVQIGAMAARALVDIPVVCDAY